MLVHIRAGNRYLVMDNRTANYEWTVTKDKATAFNNLHALAVRNKLASIIKQELYVEPT